MFQVVSREFFCVWPHFFWVCSPPQSGLLAAEVVKNTPLPLLTFQNVCAAYVAFAAAFALLCCCCFLLLLLSLLLFLLLVFVAVFHVLCCLLLFFMLVLLPLCFCCCFCGFCHCFWAPTVEPHLPLWTFQCLCCFCHFLLPGFFLLCAVCFLLFVLLLLPERCVPVISDHFVARRRVAGPHWAVQEAKERMRRAAAHANMLPQRMRHACSTRRLKRGVSDRALALANRSNDMVSADHRPPTSPPRTTSLALLRGPT